MSHAGMSVILVIVGVCTTETTFTLGLIAMEVGVGHKGELPVRGYRDSGGKELELCAAQQRISRIVQLPERAYGVP